MEAESGYLLPTPPIQKNAFIPYPTAPSGTRISYELATPAVPTTRLQPNNHAQPLVPVSVLKSREQDERQYQRDRKERQTPVPVPVLQSQQQAEPQHQRNREEQQAPVPVPVLQSREEDERQYQQDWEEWVRRESRSLPQRQAEFDRRRDVFVQITRENSRFSGLSMKYLAHLL